MFGVSASVPNRSLKAIVKYSAADPDPENSGQGGTGFAKASICQNNSSNPGIKLWFGIILKIHSIAF
jgi:hypothetical protein